MSDHKSQLSNLFVALDALGPEIQRITGELRQLQQKSEDAFNSSLETAATAAEENLKKSVKETHEATRKQVATELRAKYLKELESALAEKAALERRYAAVTKRFETEKQELIGKVSQTEQAASKLHTDLHQTRAEKQELEKKLQDVSSKLSETEDIAARLQGELRRVQAENQGLETRLQQADLNRSQAEQAVARLLADSG